jgi:transcriptional regulator with XRE-family HTH domain
VAIGVRMKELRLKKGMSLQEVADKVAASKAHIWDLETNRSKNPTMELVIALAKCFGVSVADLVGENPAGENENQRVLGMYRELRELSDQDLDIIEQMIDRLKT